MPRAQASGRRATNVSLDPALVEEARRLELNLSRLFEDRLREAIAAERRRRWLEENKEAFAGYARFVERHGIFNEEGRGW
jgi:antitoxin CcdA